MVKYRKSVEILVVANKIPQVRTFAFFFFCFFFSLLSFLLCVRVVKCNSLSILFAKVNGTISLKIY